MTQGTWIRWGVAAAAFLLIGLASMRFGHGVGLALLVASLVGVFLLDLAARKSEQAHHRTRAAGSATDANGFEAGREVAAGEDLVEHRGAAADDGHES